MNKRYIYLIGIIISCITLLTACSVKVNIDANVNSKQEIEIEEYYIERNDSITIQTKLQNKSDTIELTKTSVIINGKSSTLQLDEYDDIISLGIADLNCDGNKEVMVCHIDSLISPSYRMWSVYDNTGNYIMEIYDGTMTYNANLKTLTVVHSIHETKEPTYETNYYKY